MKIQRAFRKSVEDKVYSYESALCNWSGVLIASSLILFFLFMKTLGLYEILSLRYFNFIFLLTGILTTFYDYSKKISGKGIDYLTGLKMGLRISFTAVIPFAVFIALYLQSDTDFMNYVKENADFGKYLSPITAAGVIGLEGLVSGVLTTFMAMQYFKRNS